MLETLAVRYAAAYSAAIRYAAEREMSQLDALVKSAKDGERRGDALPRKVLADYLEENPQHLHDDETLTHLRSEPGEHEYGVHVWRNPTTNKVGAVPQEAGDIELRTLFDVNGWDDEREPWTAADDQPQIDVNGEDSAALLHDGVALWDNNQRRWSELTPHSLPRVLDTLQSRGRWKEATKLRDWMIRWWDLPDEDGSDDE